MDACVSLFRLFIRQGRTLLRDEEEEKNGEKEEERDEEEAQGVGEEEKKDFIDGVVKRMQEIFFASLE